MSSLTRNKKEPKECLRGVNKSHCCDGIGSEHLKDINSIPSRGVQKKHLKHSSNCRRIQGIEHLAVEHGSRLDESNLFLIKTVIVWILICLPGNIFALTIFFKHDETVETHDQPIQHSANLSSSVNNDSPIYQLQPVEFIDETPSMLENISETVS